MKLYAPTYYGRFKCIADKCQNSCCVDWEIDIDDISYEKYRSAGGALAGSITECDSARCFALTDGGRCPHLREDGLCNIIINYGEEYLTDICREHPRFYHLIGDRAEVGIGLVCEEAARIIITDTEPFSLRYAGERDSSAQGSDYITLAQREGIISTVVDASGSTDSKIEELVRKYSLNTDMHTVPEWLEILSGLEILDEKWGKLIAEALCLPQIHSAAAFDRSFENLLVYFLFRHASLAESKENMRAVVAFSILGVEIIKYLFVRSEKCDIDTLVSLTRLYSSEIEYSEDNTAELIFELESGMI